MDDKTKQKLVELETSWGLLQHDVEQQNGEILRLTRQLQALENTVARLLDQMQRMQLSSEQTPADEEPPPPHY